jgi:pilus assembly protein FimV
MQCDNCGYIFFQPSKKCTCCSAPYVPAQSSFDVGQENLFTIFEMAPGEGGIPGGMTMTASTAGVEDYNFTDDFDAGGAEYGVDENVLDLSDAEAEGFGVGPVSEPIGADDFEFNTSGMDDIPSRDNAGPDDFELNLDEDLPADNEAVVAETVEPEPETDVGNSMEMDFTGGFDEVEGLGFGFDETPADETPDVTTEEINLDAAPEPEISLEPELELAEEEPSLEVSEEPELDTADEQPSLELSEDISMDLPEELAADAGESNAVEEEPSMELPDDLDLAEEPELMEPTADEYAETEDDGGMEFDLDSVDLDEAEEITYVEEPEAETGGAEEITYVEEPKAETSDEEPFMDLEGLEMETPEDPEDEDLTR